MRPMSKLIQHFCNFALLGNEPKWTDAQLLESFVSRHDEAALEALVRRHAPMVWRVCLRILRNHHDAEDAFQATFLVFVRKATSISPRARVGNWLYGVAHQTALNARGSRAKRQVRERKAADMPEPMRREQELWNDLQPVLDQELSLLPDKYRTVIVLCDLEGQTKRAVAQQLGLPEGTVASRVARARTLLAKRLAAKGVRLSGGALAAELSEQAATAGVPPAVLAHTIQAVTRVAAGLAVTGLVSAKVAVLTEGVMKAMLLSKPKIATVMVLLAGVMVVGGGLLSYQPVGAQQGPVAQTGLPQPAHEQAAPRYVEAEGRIVKAPRTDEWEVELRIPVEHLGQVLAAFDAPGKKTPLDVDLLLIDRPTQTHRGKLALERFQEKAQRKGLHVLAWVRLHGPDIPGKSQLTREVVVGTVVHARIHCGIKGKAENRPARSDQEAMQGRWKVVGWETNGWSEPDGYYTAARISGDKIFFRLGKNREGDVQGYSFRLNEAQTPKQIDWVGTEGAIKGTVAPAGIYHLDGDRLVLCLLNASKERSRPTQFETEPGDGLWLIVLQREQPIVPLVSSATGGQPLDPRRGGPRDDGAEGRPIEMLQGTWHLRNLEQNGEQPSAFFLRKLIIDADRIAVESPIAPRTEFRYVVRPTTNLKQIDLIHTFGVKEGKILKGIYRLEGNRLFLCLNQAEDGARPTRFAAEAGTKVELMLLERENGEEEGTAAGDVAGTPKQRTEFKIGAVSYALPFALPSGDEILATLPAKNRPKNSRLECELMSYQINPPRLYPGVGNARLVNAHFRYTVFNLETGTAVVGYIDKDHLIPEK